MLLQANKIHLVAWMHIPLKHIKSARHVCILALVYIFNDVLKIGIYPDTFKIAKVIPVL